MKRTAAIVGMVLGLMASGASAKVVNFDDVQLQNGYSSLATGYAGFVWSQYWYAGDWGTSNVYPSGSTGYIPGTVSKNNLSYNAFGNSAYFSSSSSFTVNSLWATAAWNDGLSVVFSGYDQNSNVLYTKTVSPSATVATLVEFNWADIYKFGFSTSGGTKHPGYQKADIQLAIDDITVTVNVPAPATIALLGLGLAGIGAARRRRA